MSNRRLLASIVVVPLLVFASALRAQTAPALTGKVTSAEEGAMEGVLVSAKKAGRPSPSRS